MYKSMKLFETKYGAKTEWELTEFIKANAILRENVDAPNPELFKNALSMLINLSEKTENYELKKGIYKYLLSYYIERNESLKILQSPRLTTLEQEIILILKSQLYQQKRC